MLIFLIFLSHSIVIARLSSSLRCRHQVTVCLAINSGSKNMTIQEHAGVGLVTAIALFGAILSASAQTASVIMKNAEGKEIGSINLTQTSQGVLINAAL